MNRLQTQGVSSCRKVSKTSESSHSTFCPVGDGLADAGRTSVAECNRRPMRRSYLVDIILILKVHLALRTHEVLLDLVSAPQSPTLTGPKILDIAFAAFAVEIFLFQMTIEACETIEVELAVWTDIVTA
jgi:hypothetical protein